MKVGIIVGRWQIDTPHLGHVKMIEYVKQRSDKVVLIVGEAQAGFTNKNPLPLELRMEMVKSFLYPDDVLSLKDHPDDKVWSENLDRLIATFSNSSHNITLYGGRDSFLKVYTGKLSTHECPYFGPWSATLKRKNIGINQLYNSTDFRKGIIHTIENRFPTAYPTVDIALTDKLGNVLLGRKPNRTTWVFPGGFVDPTDLSLEDAAIRELNEEVTGIKVSEPKYLGSKKIYDTRYEGTKDGIITSLFQVEYLSGKPIAGDDLEEVEWIKMSDFTTIINNLSNHHIPLYKLLIEKIYGQNNLVYTMSQRHKSLL